jgi:hypothetical protein
VKKRPISPEPLSSHASSTELSPTPSPKITDLGEYATCAAEQLKSMGWTRFIKPLQYPSDKHPAIASVPHSAAAYLHRLSTTGVPAPSQAQLWTHTSRQLALRRGAHVSAIHHFRNFLHADMADYIKKRFWVVLPYTAVHHMPHLKLSPCGVVPQRDRRPRPIIDYTFSGVNQTSLPLAPNHSMQFGNSLQRILQRIAYSNPQFGPVKMLKFD